MPAWTGSHTCESTMSMMTDWKALSSPAAVFQTYAARSMAALESFVSVWLAALMYHFRFTGAIKPS